MRSLVNLDAFDPKTIRAVAGCLPTRSHPMTVGPASATSAVGVALSSLIGEQELFFAEIWERRAAKFASSFSGPLFSLSDVDYLLDYGGLRLPEVRMTLDRKSVPVERFTKALTLGSGKADGVADATAIRGLMDRGATLVLQGMRRLNPSVDTFGACLERDLGLPVQATVFVTPSSGSGIPAHHDLHSVFIVQTHGEREWHVASSRSADARAHFNPHDVDVPPLDNEMTIAMGDVAYIPRGFAHMGTSRGSRTSVHVTFSLRAAPTAEEAVIAIVHQLIIEQNYQELVSPRTMSADELGAIVKKVAHGALTLLEKTPNNQVGALLLNALQVHVDASSNSSRTTS